MNVASLIDDQPDVGLFRVHRAAMTAPEVFALERERIFPRCWLYAATSRRLPRPGDYVRRLIGGRPIFLVRGPTARCAAFTTPAPTAARWCAGRTRATPAVPVLLPRLDLQRPRRTDRRAGTRRATRPAFDRAGVGSGAAARWRATAACTSSASTRPPRTWRRTWARRGRSDRPARSTRARCWAAGRSCRDRAILDPRQLEAARRE